MGTIGPTLPPHLLKRKHSSDEEPAAVETAHSPKRQRSSSPVDNSTAPAPRRVLGPALPPQATKQDPDQAQASGTKEDGDTSSSDDDDFGPSLPSTDGHSASRFPDNTLHGDDAPAQEAQPAKPQREEWMLAPPTSGDWTSRVDPTKLKNRRFNTGKGAKGPASGAPGELSSLWTETPEQKRQRLQDEMMGIKSSAQEEKASNGSTSAAPTEASWRAEREAEKAREARAQIKEHNARTERSESLMKSHSRSKQHRPGEIDQRSKVKAAHKDEGEAEEEDDPSKRVFDREKDMGLGVKIGHKARGDMIARAKDFGGRFSGGKYL